MFKRRKDEERTELDAAWEDENPTPRYPSAEGESDAAEGTEEVNINADGTIHYPGSTGQFPVPNEFNLVSDTVPTDSEAREAASGVPFDEEDSFAYDAETEEFTTDADGFLDDSHTDFYEYGQRKHGVHPTPEEPEAAGVVASPAVVGTERGRHGSGRTSKQAALEEMPEHQRRSRRVRKYLIVVILLLLALLGALGYFGYHLLQESRNVAVQETTDVVNEVEKAAQGEEVSQDAATANVKKTEIPTLLPLLGKTQEEALAELGHGATVTLDSQVSDEASPMSHRLTVVLTEEPSDAKSGTPTVYLGMDANEKIVTAGYSAATASLGYGTLSFADAVSHEHVVEKTLAEAGLAIPEGSVVLPESSTYATFASDGTTLVKEQHAFEGQAASGGSDYLWTSVLVYNYTAANATGNLADTVRQIYVYVSEKESSEAAVEAKATAKREAEEKAEADRKAAEEEAARAAAEAEAAAAAEAAATSEAPAA